MLKRYRDIGGRLRELRTRLGYTSARAIAREISETNPYGHVMPEMTYIDQELGKMPHPEVIRFFMEKGGSPWWIFAGIGGCFLWGTTEFSQAKLDLVNLLNDLSPEEEIQFLEERLAFARDRLRFHSQE